MNTSYYMLSIRKLKIISLKAISLQSEDVAAADTSLSSSGSYLVPPWKAALITPWASPEAVRTTRGRKTNHGNINLEVAK